MTDFALFRLFDLFIDVLPRIINSFSYVLFGEVLAEDYDENLEEHPQPESEVFGFGGLLEVPSERINNFTSVPSIDFFRVTV